MVKFKKLGFSAPLTNH